jgi:hypothetical protein
MANLRTKPTTLNEVDTLPSLRKLRNLFLKDNAIQLKLYWQDGYFLAREERGNMDSLDAL